MEDALRSEYMKPLHQDRQLPAEEAHFSFGFEKSNSTQEELRRLIWGELSQFHPDVVNRS